MKDLIGRKVKGFKFETTGKLSYHRDMDKHIGEVGIIECYDDNFEVRFEDGYWYYPADQIEKHLVNEFEEGQIVVIGGKELKFVTYLKLIGNGQDCVTSETDGDYYYLCNSKDLKPKPTTIDVSMEEIAEWKGCSVEQLNVK